MVRVLELLGCIANGATTEEVLTRTPGAIDAFRHFLARHGAAVDLDEPILTQSAEQLVGKPPRGRSIQAILEHILESEYAYMAAFGRQTGS